MLSKLFLTTTFPISKLNIFPEIHKRKKTTIPEKTRVFQTDVFVRALYTTNVKKKKKKRQFGIPALKYTTYLRAGMAGLPNRRNKKIRKCAVPALKYTTYARGEWRVFRIGVKSHFAIPALKYTAYGRAGNRVTSESTYFL